MGKWLIKRKFSSTQELLDLTDKYFKEEKFIMMETYYEFIGVKAVDVQNWKTAVDPMFVEWGEVIQEVRERIKNYLARVIAYGQTEAELESTKVMKKSGAVKAYDYGRANVNMLKHYMNSRFKDKWDDESEEIKNDRITISIENNGDNKIE